MDPIQLVRRLFAALRDRGLVTDETAAIVEALPDAIDEADGTDLAELEADLVAAFDQLVPADADDADLDQETADLAELVAAAVTAVRGERSARAERLASLAASVRGTTTDADADSTAAPARPPLRQAAARRPASHAPQPRRTGGPSVLLAGGIPVDGGRALAEAFRDELRQTGATGRRRIATVRLDLPADRHLTADPQHNAALLASVIGEDALTAAGGLCAPTGADYRVHGIAEAHRPVRDALPVFAGDRGGVRFLRAPLVTDMADGVTVWTEANDQEPSDPATKPVHTLTCGTEVEVLVDAVTKRMQAGNFNARTHDEGIQAALGVLQAQHARTAEDNLWAAMVTASTAVTSGELLGAARDLLATLDRTAAAYRSRHRMRSTAMLRVFLPDWTRDMIRADLARQIAGDGTYAVSDEQIGAWFTVRNLAPVWSPDGGGQVFGAQGAGALLGWPSTVEFILAAEGAYVFVDGGELDLGIIRDSTLNATNDVEWFAETFEQVARVGVEALSVTADVCPSGTASGTTDISPCVTGS